MFRTSPHTSWLAVAAPDADAAFALEWRLAHLDAAAVARHGSWTVELEDDGERLDEILAAVRHWLRQRGLRSTSLALDGVPHRVSLEDDALPAYDTGVVLAHEP